MPDREASLLVIEGSDQGTRFMLTGEMLIGRGTQHPIRVLDTEASRTHARIRPEVEGWILEDLNSSNGTYVNGHKIKSAVLESGDQIRLGRTTLVYAIRSPDRSSFAHVDLVGGSSQHGHSQIIRTFSPHQSTTQGIEASVDHSNLLPDDVLYVIGEIAEQAVRPSMTLSELLDRVLRMILKTIHADRGCILLIDTDSGMVVPQASVSSIEVKSSASAIQARMPISKSIVDYVIKTGNSVRSTDPLHDTRFDPGQSILQAGVKEALCVPMLGRMTLLGAIYLDVTEPDGGTRNLNDRSEQHLTDQKLRLLTAVARQCALAIENFRYQQSLVDAERLAAIGQTIATLSHHIKNILQGVRGGSYLIDVGLKQDQRDLILKGWKLVEKNQDKIYNLVMDMLTFSKERTPTIEVASANDVVHDVFELMEQHAQEYGVQLSYLPDPAMPKSTFDSEAIHRAVLNIVTNAIDAAEHSEGEGQVELTTRFDTAEDQIVIEVVDNGPGIPHDVKDKIFNVFESTKGASGTGIGLAVSRKIMREHGGDIVVGDAPGQGARFILHWPFSNEAVAEHHAGTRTMSDIE